MLTEVVMMLVRGETVSQEQIEGALAGLCDLHSDSCDYHCPVFANNGESVPVDGNGICTCAKDGKKMMEFLKRYPEQKVYCNWEGISINHLTPRCCDAPLGANAIQEEAEFIDGELFCVYCGRPIKIVIH